MLLRRVIKHKKIATIQNKVHSKQFSPAPSNHREKEIFSNSDNIPPAQIPEITAANDLQTLITEIKVAASSSDTCLSGRLFKVNLTEKPEKPIKILATIKRTQDKIKEV